MENIGVLFDLDGVLIDSENLYTDFWKEIDLIYPTGIIDFEYVIKGNALFKILNTYFAHDVHQDIINRVHAFENDIYYPLYDGVTDFLSQLKDVGIPSAIVTSSDNVKMESLYKQHPGFKDYFNAIVTGSDVTKSKPDPQGYLIAAKMIDRAPSDCYVFEDSIQGLKAGMDSGATVIGLTTNNPVEVLKDKAHALIDSFVDFNLCDMLSVKRF